MSNALAVTGNEWTLKSGGSTWGKIHQSANKKTIKVTKSDGSITTWVFKAGTTWFEDGLGNKLTISTGQSTSVNITGGQHSGVYSAH